MAVINGTTDNDRIDGTDQADVLSGRDGNDTILGIGGADVIDGGSGDDLLYAGDGNDVLRGGEGHDTLVAGGGTDTLEGGEGNDVLQFDPAVAGLRAAALMIGGVGHDSIKGGLLSDTLSGGEGADTIDGGEGDDFISGGAGNDLITAGLGNDTVDAGAGFDQVRLSGAMSEYTFRAASTGSFTLTHTRTGGDGTDTITDVERINFRDGSIAFDLSTDGLAGQALLLIGAVIGQAPMLSKRPLMANVIALFDQGFTLQELAGAVMRLPIWAGVLTSSNSAEDKARHLLTTVLKREPTAEELQEASTALAADEGRYLADLAISDLNVKQVGLVGIAATGFDYPLPS